MVDWLSRVQEIVVKPLDEALGGCHLVAGATVLAQGRVVPDSFTHGSSEQRMRWFKKGLQSDQFDPNNTFSTRDL